MLPALYFGHPCSVACEGLNRTPLALALFLAFFHRPQVVTWHHQN